MRRSLPLALAALAALGALTACAPEAEPDATSTTAPTSEPAPAATPEPLVVPAGEKPPTVFGGDCAAALAAADLLEITGKDLALTSSESAGDVGNVGGLGCSWNADSAAVRIEILPRTGLGDAQFPADQVAYYFEDCDPQWVCSGRAETDRLWLSASFQYFPDADRTRIDEWTSALADVVFANAAQAPGEPWTRDRSGWWGELDCAAVADTLSRELGTAMSGEDGGYHDPPLPGVLLAAEASRWTNCYVSDGARPLELYTAAGEAWTLPGTADDQPFDTGVPGISAWLDSGFQSSTAAGYALTDGVNTMTVYLPTDAPWSAEDAVRALARAAASDWQ